MDPRTPENFRSLPKFLVADDNHGRDFVVHCHYPRFVMNFDAAGRGFTAWIDEPKFDPVLGNVALQAASLMREAGDFYSSTL